MFFRLLIPVIVLSLLFSQLELNAQNKVLDNNLLNTGYNNYRGPEPEPEESDYEYPTIGACSKPFFYGICDGSDHMSDPSSNQLSIVWSDIPLSNGYSFTIIRRDANLDIIDQVGPLSLSNNHFSITGIASILGLNCIGHIIDLPSDEYIDIHISVNYSDACHHFQINSSKILKGRYESGQGSPCIDDGGTGGGGSAKGFAAIDDPGKRGQDSILPSSALLITPNPVQTNANITVDLPESNPLSINIYGANGQHIQEVVTNNHMSKGLHNFNYDTSHLPTGIYYCQVQSGDKFISKKIVKM